MTFKCNLICTILYLSSEFSGSKLAIITVVVSIISGGLPIFNSLIEIVVSFFLNNLFDCKNYATDKIDLIVAMVCTYT